MRATRTRTATTPIACSRPRPTRKAISSSRGRTIVTEMKSRVVRPSSGPGPGGTEMSSMSVMSNNTINTGHHLNNNNSEGVDTVVFHHQPDCHVLAKHKLAAARRPGDPFTTATRWTIFIYRITEQYPLCWDLWHLIDICRYACFFDLEEKEQKLSHPDQRYSRDFFISHSFC